MIAYNNVWLEALSVRDHAEGWYDDDLITPEKYASIKDQYPSGFYTPNPFVRLGLSVFSALLIGAAFGLFCLILGDSILSYDRGGSVCFGILCLTVLEFWSIRKAHHYASGIDDMLLYFGLGFLTLGLYMTLSLDTPLQGFAMAFPILLVAAIRYLDRIVAAAAFGCLIAMLLHTLDLLFDNQVLIFSLSTMVVSAGVYLFVVQGQKKTTWRHWDGIMQIVELLSLCVFYAAGNYWMVNEGNIDIKVSFMPFGVVFWIFTMLIPFGYIYFGLLRNDRILLDIGLILVVAAVCTVRFYFDVMPFSWFMTLGGIVLFVGAYVAIKYLKDHNSRFAYDRDQKISTLQRLEERILEHTVSSIPTGMTPPTSNDKMGGGQFGGGGASGEF